jgi:hypothetical protein
MPAGRDARQLQVIDPVLTEVARQYRPHGFVYNQICPTINVDTLSGQYPVYDERYWFQNEQDNKIADRGETPEVEFAWSTDTYLCEDYGFKVSITPRERQQAGSVGGQALRLESSKTEFLMQQMANAREKRLASVLRKVGTGNGQITSGAGVTTVFATSTAIEADFKTAKTTVYNLTGLTPNVAIVPYLAAYDMATNVELRKIWLYQVNSENFIRLGADDEGEDIFLPRWFQGCRLLVPKGALAQTGHEGAAKSLTEVWGKDVRFLYVPPNGGGWGIPATVYQFQHEVISGMARAGNGAVIDRWSENDPRKDVIRAMECISEKVCAPDSGYVLTGAVA